MKLSKHEKVLTGHYPTPLDKMVNLSKKINKGELYIKRDDMTGLGFGGNKSRKLDYIVKEAIDHGYTTLLTYGGPQTNHGRMTAAAAAKFGLKSILMCYGNPPKHASGNIILDRMLGTEICFMDTTEVRQVPAEKQFEAYYKLRDDSTDAIIKRYEEQGEKVYVVPIGGHSVIGTIGYIDAVVEIMNQLKDQAVSADYLVTGFGSTGTFAGLWLGAKYYQVPFEVVGISVAPIDAKKIEDTAKFINQVSQELGLGITCQSKDLWIEGDYYGEGYNIPDAITRKYMLMLAETEGIFLDPCYTGKSFRGFIDIIEKGKIPSGKTSIYLHTGGTPAIWTEEHLKAMEDELWNKDQITIFEYQKV